MHEKLLLKRKKPAHNKFQPHKRFEFNELNNKRERRHTQKRHKHWKENGTKSHGTQLNSPANLDNVACCCTMDATNVHLMRTLNAISVYFYHCCTSFNNRLIRRKTNQFSPFIRGVLLSYRIMTTHTHRHTSTHVTISCSSFELKCRGSVDCWNCWTLFFFYFGENYTISPEYSLWC